MPSKLHSRMVYTMLLVCHDYATPWASRITFVPIHYPCRGKQRHPCCTTTALLFTDCVSWGCLPCYQVALSDIDVMWLRDPTPFYQRYPEADILTSSDELRTNVGKEEVLERYPEAGGVFNVGGCSLPWHAIVASEGCGNPTCKQLNIPARCSLGNIEAVCCC